MAVTAKIVLKLSSKLRTIVIVTILTDFDNGSLNIGKRVLGQVSRIGVSVNIPKTEAENIRNAKIKNSVSDFRSHLFQ